MSYTLGAIRPARRPAPVRRKAAPPSGLKPRVRLVHRARISRGTYSIAAAEASGLGFSLKPPKWIRKMKVGKTLLKVGAVAAGAAVLGPTAIALAKAAAPAVVKAGAALAKAVVPGIIGRAVPLPTDAMEEAAIQADEYAAAIEPRELSIPVAKQPAAPSIYADAPAPGSSATYSSTAPAGSALPTWLLPVAIGAGALLLVAGTRRGR